MEYHSDKILQLGKQKEQVYKNLVRRLKKEKDQTVDSLFHSAHDAVFEEMNCLDCANCCKTTSPVFTEKDVERIASALKMRPGNFSTTYLRRDEDGDLVLKTSPCPFLENDNACRIYEDRPTACRNYPHTDRKKVRQLMDLTLKNSLICPAVQEMLNRIDLVQRNDES